MAKQKPCHCLSAAKVANAQHVEIDRGLNAQECIRRLNEFGRNEIEEKASRSLLQLVADQFNDFMIVILVAAAIISGIVGDAADTITIIVILILNAAIGTTQAWQAAKAMEALKKLGAPCARVVRDGYTKIIPAAELVQGDIVLLEAGDIVPADLRIAESQTLLVDESMLTGESVAVEKQTDPLEDEDLAVADRNNMSFKGTIIANGRARGITVSTGMATELGKIAALLDSGEETKTPLQKRLATFGQKLGIVVIAICAVIFFTGLIRGEPPIVMLLTAISLAVAAVPEALPAVVTISLALGARKMVLQNALIRRLPAVETLGSVTYICSDKTGTLTQNKMSVDSLFADESEKSPSEVEPGSAPWGQLVRTMALCNNAQSKDGAEYIGSPTETAIARTARQIEQRLPASPGPSERLWEIPFDSTRKRMSTIHRSNDKIIIYAKGAPETIISRSDNILVSSGLEPVDRLALSQQAERMAAKGLRVVAFAMRECATPPTEADVDEIETGLTFLGFAGLIDPPRENAKESVDLCKSAGITPVMITGDHPITAKAIATRLDIISDGARVVSGRELLELSDDELQREISDIAVFARVDPVQKIRIVEALQARGEYVAMTGDGVNDAPALKRADIGIAMGKGGTDVAREAAHLVLFDDNFSSIVSAVREGRRIFENIRKFIKYTMTSNAGEVWTIFLAPFMGLPIPLLPIHILWINLVTDGLPGLALTAEKAEDGIMERPPRPPNESIFARGMWQHIAWCGLAMGLVCLSAQAWAISADKENWQTIIFTVLTLSQMGHVLAIRSDRSSLFVGGFFRNRPLIGAVALTFLLQLAVIYVPFFNSVFHTAPLSASELLTCIGLSSIVFFMVEIEKALHRRGLIYEELKI